MLDEVEIIEEPGKMTTITIPVTLAKSLIELKLVPQESYYSVIFRLLEEHDKSQP